MWPYSTATMMRKRGNTLYNLYKSLTTILFPFLHLHLHYRKFRGLEHSSRWPERLGIPSLRRPPGLLLWFHAVSLGEGMAAIPVIRRCLIERPDLNILMTTTTVSGFEVLKNQLPPAVIYQFAPLDIPAVVDAFLSYWKPSAIILLESELWPNLIMSAAINKIFLALLNARMSEKSFRRWSAPSVLPLITLMLSKFSLISPLSTTESIRFQLLQAPPLIISSSADLKYAVGRCAMSKNSLKDVEDLRLQLSHRPSWMASSIHKGEHEVILQAHKKLLQNHNSLLTVIVPRHPQHGYEFAQRLREEGFDVAVRPDGGKLTSATNVYMVNTLGELREFYRLMPIAVVGGSFLPDLAGHNISEAMASGCAVLTGPHIGHFSHMVSAMQRFNNLSVLQVSKESELITALHELLSDPVTLEARQSAAEQAFNALSSGVLAHVWIQLDRFILRKLPI
ncbi:putative 3-deoxy-D-manno-octulosonic acid transferase, mitochondrial isoform X3 [Silene latifolia]|uniref:putative 3-deoxy-D-manno-octulosonic acid transferase, mitochondrial isoform X3 n=1 Tax=Silene latifolia TaxID=37657 RepID=UPI003D76AADF